MKKRTLSILLILVMAVCLAGVLYYPISKSVQMKSNETDMDQLRVMRRSALDNSADLRKDEQPSVPESEQEQQKQTESSTTGGSVSTEAAVRDSRDVQEKGGKDETSENRKTDTAESDGTSQPSMTTDITQKPDGTTSAKEGQKPEGTTSADTAQKTETTVSPEAEESKQTGNGDAGKQTKANEGKEETSGNASKSDDKADGDRTEATEPSASAPADTEPSASAKAGTEPEQSAEPEEEIVDRHVMANTAIPYPLKEHVQLDPGKILPQYREMYEMNHDLVGWLYIPGTNIDYPVVQNEDPDYYLTRDFFGETNSNGQLVVDSICDVWTPSYNMVISGHNMKSGKMFGGLSYYASYAFWKQHKTFVFDSLLREGTYVVIAAFYSADYDEDEEGFRYNADIQYRLDAEFWLKDIEENREYDTGVDAEFGDEFLTLTTCYYQRENGRFVVIARRVREGEEFE